MNNTQPSKVALFTLPNLLTCCNLMCGCMATGAAFYGNYRWALVMIICGAVFDFFDGMVARLLGISSPIGKELDSLADIVTFGVAPSAVLFYLFHEVHYPAMLQPVEKFWASLVVGQHAFLASLKFNAVFLFLFMVLSCLLLVAEIPLFALKFKDYTWRNNSVKYIFLFGCAMCLCLGVSGIAAMIVWYVALSMATNGRPGR